MPVIYMIFYGPQLALYNNFYVYRNNINSNSNRINRKTKKQTKNRLIKHDVGRATSWPEKYTVILRLDNDDKSCDLNRNSEEKLVTYTLYL